MMEENFFKKTIVETPRNSEQKCLCVLCLDVSASMDGAPIQALNEGVRTFIEAVKKDPVARKRLEVAIITFGSRARVIQEPELVDFFEPPQLKAAGVTAIAEAIRKAIRLIEKRKEFYKQHGINYYRPFIILMTDGEPNDIATRQEVDILAHEIHRSVEEKKIHFLGYRLRRLRP